MKRKELQSFYYIQREIEMWEAELETVGYMTSTRINGAPAGNSMPGNPTAREAAKYEKIKEKIEVLRDDAVEVRVKIYKHIAEIDDSLMRQIVMHRCISLERWEDVARAVGGGNTADSVRKRFERAYPE